MARTSSGLSLSLSLGASIWPLLIVGLGCQATDSSSDLASDGAQPRDGVLDVLDTNDVELEPEVSAEETTTDGPVLDEPAPEDEQEDEIAPVVATVHLDGGVTVEFIALEETRIGIVFGGPVDADLDPVAIAISGSASPLELYETLVEDESETRDENGGGGDINGLTLSTPAVPEAPPGLRQLSDAVVGAGNWAGCVSDEPKALVAHQPPGHLEAPPTSPSRPVLTSDDSMASPADWCDNLDSWGDKLPDDNGNCTLYLRDNGESTQWVYDDITAFAGHVIAHTGTVDWEVRHRNCNSGCNYTTDYQKVIAQGFHYYFAGSDNNDDFRTTSTVYSQTNGGKHYHDVARIHDWDHRTEWTSYWKQAHGIDYNSDSSGYSSLYCTETPYEGVDPSNIFTSGEWFGTNELEC